MLRWQPYESAADGLPLKSNGYSWWGDADILRVAQDRGCVLVAGAFDGLHAGHRELVSAAIKDAQRRGTPSVALTFDPDPMEVLQPHHKGALLLSCDDRARGLLELGVDAVLSLQFTMELAQQSPECFVCNTLCERVRPLSIHVGENFHFGVRGTGDVSTLAQLGEELGFEVRCQKMVQIDGEAVSASRVRELLRAGDIATASALLQRCHYVRGTVAHGRGEGTGFGFPTANVVCDLRTCMPAEGVYACYVIHEGQAWPAAANVGAPPTFAQKRAAFLEANLLGFEGNLYGANVAVSFVEWLRPSRVFSSLEELESVVLGNIDWVRQNLGDKARGLDA